MRESIVDLTPLRLSNLPRALWIAWESFRDEWHLVWLTYAWHLARVHGLPTIVPMVRRRRLRLDSEGRYVGTIDIVSTPVHEPDVRWIVLDLRRPVESRSLAALLMRLMPRCRLAVLQSPGRADYLEQAGPIEYEGTLPGSEGSELAIYSLRRRSVVTHHGNGLSLVPGECSRPEVHAEFHLIRRGPRTVGITGLYVADPWPHIGWGGWGTIRRPFAHRHTVLDSLAATEDLARCLGRQWFCIMTSSAPQYRSACRMYEYYGLARLLDLDDFFRSGRGTTTHDSYLVYGRRL